MRGGGSSASSGGEFIRDPFRQLHLARHRLSVAQNHGGGMAEEILITQKRHLELWLMDRSAFDALDIAARSALRVAPALWYYVAKLREGELEVMPFLRCNLIANIASGSEGLALNRAARVANSVAKVLFSNIFLPANSTSNSAFYVFSAHAALSSVVWPETDVRLNEACANTVQSAAFSAQSVVRQFPLTTFPQRRSRASVAVSVFWRALSSDATKLSAAHDPWAFGLFPEATPIDQVLWPQVKAAWQKRGPGWQFWIDWYEGYLTGKPLNPKMLEEIALIPSEDWDKGADHVNGEILKIVDSYRPKAPTLQSILSSEILEAALVDFSFDEMSGFMTMVSFPQDLEYLNDPVRLKETLRDAETLIASLQTFDAMAAGEAGRRQGASPVLALSNSILGELNRAYAQGELRVGLLVEYGASMQRMSVREETIAGLGDDLAPMLQQNVKRLQALLRRHFAKGLLRLQPLETLTLAPTDKPMDLLKELESGLEAFTRAGQKSGFALKPEEVAELKNVLSLVRDLAHGAMTATHPDIRRDQEKQLAQQVGLFALTLSRLALRTQEKSGIDTSEIVAETWKNLQFFGKAGLTMRGLMELMKFIGQHWPF